MNLEKTIKMITEPSGAAEEKAARRWNSIAKPLYSLGVLEEILNQIAGITGTADINIKNRALVTFCADNGVVEEGVTQTGQNVTAIVGENFLDGCTSACAMCRASGTDIIPVDMGMIVDTRVRTDHKVAYGTKNMAKGPAMSREEAVRALEGGIAMAEEMKAKGYTILAAGEMGIGNTTSSSAVASVLLGVDPEIMTGRGAGLSDEGLKKKQSAIKRAIDINKPDPQDAVDVLAKVGGFDIGGMAGFYLGAAALHIPVVLDGVISCTAALVAASICPTVTKYMIASHVSKEPAAHMILEKLGKQAILHANMFLGEGTGAVALFPVLDMACAVYNDMSTFEDIKVEQYEDFRK